MAKFNHVLVTGYRQQQEYKKKQLELKVKHHIDDPDVVVVEKNNMAKFTIKTLISVLRTTANILLVLLAIIGVLALIYPETRAGLLEIWKDTVNNLSHLL